MGDTFVPEGDKVHTMMQQRPGAFVIITEQGRIFEVTALMEAKKVMAREWEHTEWDEPTVEAENARVQTEIMKMQAMQQQGQGQPQRAPSGILKPGQIARPGTI